MASSIISRRPRVLQLLKTDSCVWRAAVTLTSTSPATHTPPTATAIPNRPYTSEPAGGGKKRLAFEEYRKLRKTLKMRARLAGIPLAFVGMGISSFVNVQLNPRMFEMQPEEVQPILGLDPIVFSALCGVGSGVIGYMVGGALFTATWRMLYRQQARELEEMNNDFLNRVEEKRFSGVSRYEDDYYADKVLTPSDYRQWVRQQQKRKEYAQQSKDKETTG